MRVLWFGRYKSHSIYSTSNAQACLLKSSTRHIRTCWPGLAVLEPPGGVAARIEAQIQIGISQHIFYIKCTSLSSEIVHKTYSNMLARAGSPGAAGRCGRADRSPNSLFDLFKAHLESSP